MRIRYIIRYLHRTTRRKIHATLRPSCRHTPHRSDPTYHAHDQRRYDLRGQTVSCATALHRGNDLPHAKILMQRRADEREKRRPAE